MGSDAIAAYYDDLVNRYGHDPRAVDASSQDSLELRYEALAAVCDLNGKSVLEVGCGFGDLGAYLLDRFACDYRGIDVSRRMIEEGRQVHPELDLLWANVLDYGQGADVVLAQGIFYLLPPSKANLRTHRLITRMFDLASEAVAFTAISSWHPNKQDGQFYLDPCFAFGVSRSLTNRVVLRHDYHPGDLCMYLYR